jgi:hypothetical protein
MSLKVRFTDHGANPQKDLHPSFPESQQINVTFIFFILPNLSFKSKVKV